MNDADYKIILEAVNKTAPAFKSVKKSVADVDKVYKKSLKKMEKQTKSFNKTLKKIEPTLNTIGTVGAVAFAGIVYGLKKAIDVASDFEETNSKFEVVFKDVGTQAEAMAQRLQYSYGLSGLASRQLLSSTGDLLTGFGFTGDSALDLSGKVNTLAVDLASFTNAQGGAVAVSDALTKALLGERDSLKTYGIAILDADVKAELLAKGQSKLTGEALRQASAYATLDIAMRQSKNAQGDFERTQESYANQVRVAQARIEDLSVAIGTAFLPAVTEMIVEITPLITKIGKWSEENQGAVKVLAELAISITALSASLRILTPVVSFLTSAW
ncbi:MAG: phage tail tape measure protein, partial [Gammaproteobacteria bacterium]|nr:phage tail tape measure protein [Gammaproteobacteria bacterium]